MASGQKNYFRHSMNARNDHKLKTFMGLFGRNWREGYFYFFSLLELCGNDAQDGQTEHTFHINTLRELWGTSTKGAHDVCMKCTSSALVMCNTRANHVTFSIPNLLNYTGKYAPNAPNKEIKEKKEKKEIIISASDKIEQCEIIKKPSPLSFLFHSNPELQNWLNEGIHETHLMLLKKYSHHELADLIEKAFAWAAPRSIRAESWLYTFVSNKNTQAFNPNQAQASFKTKTHGVVATPENPTGNPYTAQRLAKEREA